MEEGRELEGKLKSNKDQALQRPTVRFIISPVLKREKVPPFLKMPKYSFICVSFQIANK